MLGFQDKVSQFLFIYFSFLFCLKDSLVFLGGGGGGGGGSLPIKGGQSTRPGFCRVLEDKQFFSSSMKPNVHSVCSK